MGCWAPKKNVSYMALDVHHLARVFITHKLCSVTSHIWVVHIHNVFIQHILIVFSLVTISNHNMQANTWRHMFEVRLHSFWSDLWQSILSSGSTGATKCPNTASGGLCDCGGKSCNYGIGEYLDPNTCNCKVDVSKRSLNKRNADDDEVPIAAPRGGAGNLISKRSINYLRKPNKKINWMTRR